MVQIDNAQTNAARLVIVLDDGRAFDRTIELVSAAPQERSRLVASTVANLVAGIEAGRVPPDRSDVPLPLRTAQPPACPQLKPLHCPAPHEPALTAPAPPKIAIGLSAGLPITLGLGAPASADRFAAWGGELGLWLRLRRGVTLLTGIRPSGRTTVGDVRIIRTRVTLGAGYTLRWGSLELAMLALGTVEPWGVRVNGHRAEFDDIPTERTLLVGGGARLSPGLRWSPPGSRLATRIGPYTELLASGGAGSDLAVPQILLASESASRLRAGGVEATAGLECVLWFDVGS